MGMGFPELDTLESFILSIIEKKFLHIFKEVLSMGKKAVLYTLGIQTIKRKGF